MHRFILFWALLVLMAAPALAADTNHYPSTIADQTCTDSYDAPAATTPGRVTIGPGTPSQANPAAQTSGDPDGYCDNDSRIVTGALTADTLFGPFTMNPGYRGFLLWWDVDAIIGGSTDASVRIFVKKPSDGSDFQVSGSQGISATGDVWYDVGPGQGDRAFFGADAEVALGLPYIFYIHMNLVTATSITFEMSTMAYTY